MRYILLLSGLLISHQLVFSQDKPAYQLYTSKGKEVKYGKMIKDLAEADIFFFGELHDNPVCHWLEYEVALDLYRVKKGAFVMGAEMFETDDQLILGEYLSGLITEERFLEEAGLWNNYKTDYAPLVKLAKDSAISFIATNVPRRYANLVFREGFYALDSLSDEARQYMAPLPIPFDPMLKNYMAMIGMGGMGDRLHGSENLPKAQAVKDATMAHFIVSNRNQGQLFLHFNGDYHSKDHEGIVWYVNRYEKGLNIKVISSVLQESPGKLEEINEGRGDYILVIPESMTRTY